jgi:hypothetical protein
MLNLTNKTKQVPAGSSPYRAGLFPWHSGVLVSTREPVLNNGGCMATTKKVFIGKTKNFPDKILIVEKDISGEKYSEVITITRKILNRLNREFNNPVMV